MARFRLTNKSGDKTYYDAWNYAYVDWTSNNDLVIWEEYDNYQWIVKSHK